MTKNFMLASAAAAFSMFTLGLNAQAIFTDDFESGISAWLPTGTSPLEISSAQNLTPAGVGQSAYLNSSLDKSYHNLGVEVAGAARVTFNFYDSTATRAYGEARSYVGAGYNDGSLQNLIAIGKYNSVTMLGEVFDATKYQARISATGFGWFNLNAEGAPSRSTGWHQFDIERNASGTSISFFVDGILSRTISGAPDFTWDVLTIGSVAAGSTAGDAWFDGISVTPVPEPSLYALLAGLGLTGFAAYRRQTRKA